MVKQKETIHDVQDGTNLLLRNYIVATRNGEAENIKNASSELETYILDKVKESIDELYEKDIFLLQHEMNEMTVCGRLAMYLQNRFSDFMYYSFDVEYYRLTKPLSEVKDKRSERIRCDILFHSRQHYEDRVDNLLAIEVKLDKNIDNGGSDICRLADFVLPKTTATPIGAIHSTLLGLFLKFGKDGYSKVIIKDGVFVPVRV